MMLEKFNIGNWKNIMEFDEYLALEPYGSEKNEKRKILSKRVSELTLLHMEKCQEYRRMMKVAGFTVDEVNKIDGEQFSYEDVPFLPVRLFKELSLKSVGQEEVVKTMTSSGTTGQMVSKIYLDRVTSANQQKVMVKIVSDFTGAARMPMLIIDCPSVVQNRQMFSARGAGILGFSMFARDKVYALRDEDMSLDVNAVMEFLRKHEGEKIFLFGFTFMIWQYFYRELVRLKGQGIVFDLSGGILIHGGGWKKLAGEAVSPLDFKKKLKDICGLKRVHDYYGMVEQTGCIYMECECGYLHASVFSDVIVRNPKNFAVCRAGEKGILEVISSIPESYPGHCLLTEDVGEIIGEDDCPCGRKGKYFKIEGRLQNAEIRGCSDTFEVRN